MDFDEILCANIYYAKEVNWKVKCQKSQYGQQNISNIYWRISIKFCEHTVIMLRNK